MASSSPSHSLLCSQHHPSPTLLVSDLRHPLLPSRTRCGVKLASFTLAAATMAGVQLTSVESVAIASTASVVDVAIEKSAVLSRDPRPEDILRLNFSVPVAHQYYPIVFGTQGDSEEILRSFSSHHGHRSLRRSFKSSGLKCPKWTPSEFELIMPNLQGPPKPFPKEGHQWAAIFVATGVKHELFVHVLHHGTDYMNSEEPLIEEMLPETETKGQSFKMGKERFICFTM